MFDQKATAEIQEWLSTPDTQKDIEQGAMLLLRINGNKFFHANVLARPDKHLPKLIYELEKHLRIRLDKMTADGIEKMQEEVTPRIHEILDTPVVDLEDDVPSTPKVAKGKRADHDELPPEIRALWDCSCDLFIEIKTLFEQLKTMNDLQPCDRYDTLKMLDAKDKLYRQNLAAYDAYVADAGMDKETATKLVLDLADELMDLPSKRTKKYAECLARLQSAFDFIKDDCDHLDGDFLAKLSQLGVKL